MSLLKSLQRLQIRRHYSSKIRLKSKSNELSSMEIRNIFVDYFIQEQSHKFIRSSPVVPFCDPTVPFVNAGMNQFKNIFLGKAAPSCNAAVNSQKCIRAGGKHNDLDIIGTDGYHHTFFEMLGNWSFGDYFKEKACRMAWEVLTNFYQIDPTRLYVTYFGGDTKLGLPPDLECKEIWRSIGVPSDRILPFGVNENFWEMGASGPCGTCTEIHFDHLLNSDPSQRAQFVNAGLPDLTELWNVVFIEYNRKSDGAIEPLKEKFIDTGMGFERLVALLQGKSSNYDSDLFLPIFDAISKESGKAAYGGIFDPNDSNYQLDYAYRLVADHARMCSVCIADGMYPQTNHRLRKIMRRTLNVCEAMFQKTNIIQTAIVPKIVESLGAVYPEIETHSKSICDIFTFEDESHKSLIENNRKNFKSLKIATTSNIKEVDVIEFSQFPNAYRDVERQIELNRSLKSLPVEFVYNKLYLAHGLNEDLIKRLAAEKKLKVDMKEFAVYKQMKKDEAKSQHQIEESILLEKSTSANLPPTAYLHMYDYVFDNKLRQFVVKPLTAKVSIVDYDATNDLFHIVLDKTNFYHTAGGQDSDIGQMVGGGGTFDVKNVTIHNGFVVHTGHFVNGSKPFQSNEQVTLNVNSAHRTTLSQHHTVMHLLQAAMKKVTSRIVFQQSSHVSAANLKCEFGTIGKRINLDQWKQIEQLIRLVIQSKIPISVQYLAAHELYALNNLTTVPGATYPDNGIRVLQIKDETNEFESIEPCCGTHASNTSELEDFCFTSVKVNNSASYDITAVAGRLVETIKANENEILRIYESFKNKVYTDKNLDAWEAVEIEASQIKRQLADSQLPYITSARIFNAMEALDKHIRVTKRELIRQAIVSEMIDVLTTRKQNNDPFVVHVIKTKAPLEKMLLVEAEQMCNDLPVILLNVSNNKIVQGRASVPLKYMDKRYDAKDWLQELVGSFNVKCSKAKKKYDFIQSNFEEIPNQATGLIEPLELEEAVQRTKQLAEKMFKKKVSANEGDRHIQSFQLKNAIQDIRSKLHKVSNLNDLLRITSLATNLRNDIKVGLHSYELKLNCLTELAEINDQMADARHKIESEIHGPGLERTLSTASLNKRSYAFHVIHASHPLSMRTIIGMTDLFENTALVLIIVSHYDVIGRITIPFNKPDAKPIAKKLRDEFCSKFNGKCNHEGERREAFVTDFQFEKSLVNDESLKNAFEQAERLLIGKS